MTIKRIAHKFLFATTLIVPGLCQAATVTELTFLPTGINNLGGVTGFTGSIPATANSFYWQNGLTVSLGSLVSLPTVARAINDLGQIAGESNTQVSPIWLPHAVRWQNGSMVDISSTFWSALPSRAFAINNNGDAVGEAYTGTFPSSYDLSAVLFQNNGTGVALDQAVTTPSSRFSSATDINDSNQIVGNGNFSGLGYKAAIWYNGSLTRLLLPNEANYTFPNPRNNNAGQIVGTYTITSSPYAHAFLWQNGIGTDVTPTGYYTATASDINNVGQIVGWTIPTSTSPQHATIWVDGVATDLNTLAGVTSSGWTLTTAIAINDSAQIIGVGRQGGQSKYYLLNAPELIQIKSDPTTPQDPTLVASNDISSSPTEPGCLGMCGANAHTMQASLLLTDTPVGYRPPYGPAAYIRLSYSHLTTALPSTFNFFNVGPKWSINLLSFIQDNPNLPGSNVTRLVAGGGTIDYNADAGSYNVSAGTWGPERNSQAILKRIPATGAVTGYELTFPDGAKQIFSRILTGTPRRVLLSQIVDSTGKSLTYTYDAQNRLTDLSDASNRVTKLEYTHSNPLLVTKISDPFGRSSTITYDTTGRLDSITDIVGIKSIFTYDSSDTTFIKQLATPYGTSNFATGVAGASNSRWLELTDPLNATERVEIMPNATGIDANPTPAPSGIALESGTYALNNTFYWNKYAYMQAITKTGGVITGKDYTKASVMHWLTNAALQTLPIYSATKAANENYVFFNYPNQSQQGRPGSIDRPSKIGTVLDGGASKIDKSEYNSIGKITSTTDALDRNSTYTYSTSGVDLLKIWQKDSATTQVNIGTYTYNSAHQPLTYKDPAERTWTYTYNAAGQITSVQNPLAQITQFAYDSYGRPTTVTNANNVIVKEYHYPCNASIDGSVNCNLPDWIKQFDGVDSNGYKRNFVYDKLDRVTQITYPDNTTELFNYNFPNSWPPLGSVVYANKPSLDLWKYTDRMGRSISYVYDNNRRTISKTEDATVLTTPTTRTTNYVYFGNGILKELNDANGNKTRWAINEQGRVTSKTYAFGTASAKTETYTYDATGRLKKITDALEQEKTIGYNLDDTPASFTYTKPPGSTLPDTGNVSYAYDMYWPRLTSMTDRSGPGSTSATTTFNYTPLGIDGALQLQTEHNGAYYNQHMGYFYDALGRLSQRWSAESPETFGYDSLGRLTSYNADVESGNPIVNIAYGYLGQSGLVTTRTARKDGTTPALTSTYSYDTTANDRRLLGIGHPGAVRSFSFSYAANATATGAKNPYTIATVTDTAPVGHPRSTQTWTNSYDRSDRLLGSSGSVTGAYNYQYDALDNIKVAQNPVYTDNPNYNGLNQVTNYAWWQNFTHDANGNVTSDGNRTYKWDMEGRLLEINFPTNPGYVMSYLYDGLGRRISNIVNDHGTITPLTMVWCGQRPCQLRTSTTSLRRYLTEGEYDNNAPNRRQLYMADQLGSVRDMVEVTTGARIGTTDYTPYGGQRGLDSASGIQPHFQYAGLFWDGQAGLNISATRFYDGGTGRWLNRDWIRETGGVNLYSYVGSDPINFSDASGLFRSNKWLRTLVPGQVAFDNMMTSIENRNYINAGINGVGGALEQVTALLPFRAVAKAATTTIAICEEAMTAGNFSRPITQADLGIQGELNELRGTFSMNGNVATMQVDMINAEIKNSMSIMDNMMATARAAGATTLEVQGTIANSRLYDALARRYGLVSEGAVDKISIPLK